jgi:hypothetical protein
MLKSGVIPSYIRQQATQQKQPSNQPTGAKRVRGGGDVQEEDDDEEMAQ